MAWDLLLVTTREAEYAKITAELAELLHAGRATEALSLMARAIHWDHG